MGGGSDSDIASVFFDPYGTATETTSSGVLTYHGVDLSIVDNFNFSGISTFALEFGPGFNDGFGAYYQDAITNTSYASGASLEIRGLQGALTSPNYTPFIVYGSTDDSGDNANVVDLMNYSYFPPPIQPATNTAPPLSVRVSGRSMVMSWPTNMGDYTLVCQSSCTGTNWVRMTNRPTVNSNGQNQVTIPIPGDAQGFFILESTN